MVAVWICCGSGGVTGEVERNEWLGFDLFFVFLEWAAVGFLFWMEREGGGNSRCVLVEARDWNFTGRLFAAKKKGGRLSAKKIGRLSIF